MKRGKENPHVANSSAGSTRREQVSSGSVSEGTVRGERAMPSVSTIRSLQSRVSSIMACGLMMILGAGMLTWYYTSAISRQSLAKRNAQSAVSRRAQGEMPLPALDGFNSLKTSTSDARHPPSELPTPAQPAPEPMATLNPPTELPLMQSKWGGAGTSHASYGHANRKSAEQLAQERLLAGAAFARESGARAAFASESGARAAFAPESIDGFTPASAAGGEFSHAGALTAAGSAEGNSTGGDFGSLLRPTAVASARARVLPTQRFLLAKGAFIDCTLETAIDSTLPGMTTCITATDTFSSDGTVVLLERGTKLIGETRGQVQRGAVRVFVLWTEARTPTGIVVPLDSPGADELGRSGLSGEVNRHFWDRFGAAILISTLDGAVQAAVESGSRGGGAVIYNPSTSEGVVTDVLKNSVNIPPTVTKRNGDRIQVFVARDLDFRSVYELRAVATGR
jgi:type IV secretion system protein VirB10